MDLERGTVRVVRNDTEHGIWELAQAAPHPALRPHVLRYSGYHESRASLLRRVEVPNGEIVVILNLGARWQVSGGASAADCGSFVAGLWDRPALVRCEGAARCLQVDLTPTGAARLLGAPLRELVNRTLELDDLLGRAADTWADRLASLDDWPARFALLDRWLLGRMTGSSTMSATTAHAWRLLAAARGGIAVAALAAEVGCSRQHLSDRFSAEIGIGPKLAARMLRFRHAVRTAQDEGGAGWAEIAAACGYADQAHLIRDFHRFAGEPPTALAARMLPDGGGLLATGP